MKKTRKNKVLQAPVLSVTDEEESLEPMADLPAATEHSLKSAVRGTDQQDFLKQYLREISQYPLLTIEEELKLAKQLFEKGDMEAAKRLVRANLRLVVKIAMEYRSAYQNLLDLIQEGNIGLMKAVSKFDPTKGAKLSYYASWWIRSYILKYILDNFRLVRIGTTQVQKKLFFNLMREKEKLEAQGIQVAPKLLADRLHVTEKDVIEMEERLGVNSGDVNLDSPVRTSALTDGRALSHMDLLRDPHAAPDESIAQDELKQILNAHLDEFVATLKEKEKAVFQERLASETPKTLQEVADEFGLTRERVRQIEAGVIQKLKEFFESYL